MPALSPFTMRTATMSSLPPPVELDFHGLPALKLSAPGGASAVITRHGAQLLSWTPVGGAERLFLSDAAVFDGRQAIRGGVPVIFPKFGGDGPLRHGFARGLPWEVVDARSGEDFSTVTLRLVDSDATRALWPHAFEIEMTVMLSGKRLDLELGVENPGNRAFSFTAALHTYLQVHEVENVTLRGLEGLSYVDQLSNGAMAEEEREALLVDREVDRIYLRVNKPLVLTHPRGGAVALEQQGFPDVVVWNPWEEKCAALPDMQKDGFRRMLCVEAAAAHHPIRLDAGESWFGRQTLVAM